MTRNNGTPSDARTAGKGGSLDPLSAARPTVPPGLARRAQRRMTVEIAAELQIEPLELRARAWHFEMIGAGCECFADGVYPCDDCQAEAFDLLQLLQKVVDETITTHRLVQERSARIPRGRRQP